jgi:ABC-type multidrug transport system fused ATPase/permease subunit
MNNLYHPFSRWVSIFIVDVPQQTIGAYLFTLIITHLIGLDIADSATYSILILTSLVAYSTALLAGQVMPDAMSALVLFGAVASFNVCFAGYAVWKRDMESWLLWGLSVCYARYAMGYLFKATFEDLFYLGSIFVIVFDYDNMSLSKSMVALTTTLIAAQVVVLCSMCTLPSQLRPCELIPAEEEVTSVRITEVELSSKLASSLLPPDQAERSSTSRHTIAAAPRPSEIREGADNLAFSVIDRASNLSSYVLSHAPPLSLPANTDAAGGSRGASRMENTDIFKVSRVIEDSKKINLAFESIQYSLPRGDQSGADKVLLHGVSAEVSSGRMCALMGPSGAGTVVCY